MTQVAQVPVGVLGSLRYRTCAATSKLNLTPPIDRRYLRLSAHNNKRGEGRGWKMAMANSRAHKNKGLALSLCNKG